MSANCSYASILESLSASYKLDASKKLKSLRTGGVSFREQSVSSPANPSFKEYTDQGVAHPEEDGDGYNGVNMIGDLGVPEPEEVVESSLALTLDPRQSQNNEYSGLPFPPSRQPIAYSATAQAPQIPSRTGGPHASSQSIPSVISGTTAGTASGTAASSAGSSTTHGARFTPTGAVSISQNGVFLVGLDEAISTFKRMVLDAYAQGVGESVEHELALLAKDNAVLQEKLASTEQELQRIQHEHKLLKALETHKSECCERMADLISCLKQEKRDALMLHRLLLRWKRNARLEASYTHVVNTLDDIRKSRIMRNAIIHWRLMCYKKRYMRVFEDAHDAVAKVREERELYFKEERERYKQEIELLQAERNEYLIKEKGLKDQMKQAFLRGINALTDEATTALDQDGTLRGKLQGIIGNVDTMGTGAHMADQKRQTILSEQIAIAETDCDYQAYLAKTEQESTSTNPGQGQNSINHEALLYPKQRSVGDYSYGANTTETFSGFGDEEIQPHGVPCNYYTDDSPMSINVIQHGVTPGQHRAQPIHRQEATGVVDPSTVRPTYLKHVKTSRGPAPVTAATQRPEEAGKFQMNDCLSKRLRSLNSMTDRRDNMSTAMYHENLTSVKNRVSVSRN